jgi:hypothetical protein
MYFKAHDLARAQQAFEAVKAAALAKGTSIENMLGPAQGRAPQVIELDDGGALQVPGAGDPAYWYAAVRSEISPEELTAAGVDLSVYGIELATAEESAAVLGVWA